MEAFAEHAWSDGDLEIRIANGALQRAAGMLADHGFRDYELVTTKRALQSAPRDLVEAADRVHEVPSGPVPDLSAALLPEIGERPRLVSLGGGRVVDTAKALAAVRGGEVAAIPTTLSGAELTSLHRMPEGAGSAAQVRPRLVLVDPSLLGSVSEPSLRASAGNALAHGADALIGPRADAETARRTLSGAGLIAAALDQAPSDRNLTGLALGSALCAIALERGGLSIHHVLAQSLVRVFETAHAETHSAVLPHSLVVIAARAPDSAAGLAAVLGSRVEVLPERIQELAGVYALGPLGAERDRLGEVVEIALARLSSAPGERPDADELTRILEAAF